MLGPALISAVVAFTSADPTPVMSLPPEDLFCEQPPAPPPPVRGRVCMEINGVLTPECRPEAPAPLPEHTPSRVLRVFAAKGSVDPSLPLLASVEAFHDLIGARQGHARLPDEPPRAV